MNYRRYLTVFFLITGLSLMTISCGDDPASSDEEPPELPTFENFNPDVSYFDGNIPSESPAFMASVYASSVVSISQTGMGYSTFFGEANEEEASFENGKWVWEYTYNWGGESAVVVLESEERADATYWSMTWSTQGTKQDVENFTMVEGWVSHDGSSGSWQFNTLNDETGEHYPLMVTEWDWESETLGSITTSYYDGDTVATSYTFEQDGNDFFITLDSASDDNNLYISWTEGAGGYYQEGENETNRQCWNSNYEEIACS